MLSFIHDLSRKIMQRFDEALPLEKQEQLLRKFIPSAAQFLRSYFRLKIEGLENIPRKGPAIIIANHSSVTAVDAVMLAFEIHQKCKRIPRLIAHRLWFVESRLSALVSKMGLVEATKENTGKLLKKGNLVILFPEGEEGNFKPSSKAYHLREFKRGFVRLALQYRVPVIPVAIVGAEEAHFNLTQFRFTKDLIGAALPLPLNIVPLPSKWHIRILPPLKWSTDKEFKMSPEDPRIRVLAHRVRKNIMHEIHQMIKERGHAFF